MTLLGVLRDARVRQRRRRVRIALLAASAARLGLGLLVANAPTSPRLGGQLASVRPGQARLLLAGCAQPSPAGPTEATPAKAFLAILGALRRPATKLDALPQWVSSDLERRFEVFVRYVRLAQTAFGSRYYLVPVFGRTLLDCKLHESVLLEDVGADQAGGGGGNTVGDIETETFRGSIGGGVPPTTFPTIVPDGVASVTAHYPAGKAGGFDRHDLPAATVTARAVNNVIVLRVPRGGQQAYAAATLTWRASDGQVIKTVHGVQ